MVGTGNYLFSILTFLVWIFLGGACQEHPS